MTFRLAVRAGCLAWLGIVAAVTLGAAAAPAAAASYQVIHSFADGVDGKRPGLVVAGPQGTLFVVVDIGAGSGILRFIPPAPGTTAWSETQIAYLPFRDPVSGTLYNGYGSLIADAAGNLFGTTRQGGTLGGGTVFELSPPGAGQTSWRRATLYSFARQPPYYSIAPTLAYRDSSGVFYGRTLYGGAANNGTIFRLAPASSAPGSWKLTNLTTFGLSSNPGDGELPTGLTAAQGGTFYGSTSEGGTAGGGTLFRLTPPAPGQTSWARQTLANFAAPTSEPNPQPGYPVGDPKVDRAANVFGVLFNGGSGNVGVVYRASPPAAGGTGWTKTILHEFTNAPDGAKPAGPLIEDAAGRLFGTTYVGGAKSDCGRQGGCGVVFQLTTRNQGGQVTPWNEAILHTFAGPPDGLEPSSLISATLADGTHALFGTTNSGGAPQPSNFGYGWGTLYEIIP